MTSESRRPPLAVALTVGTKVFTWQGDRYKADDGEEIDAGRDDVRRALRDAELRVARRLIEAVLDDGLTLAHLAQPRQIPASRVYVNACGSFEAGLAAGDLMQIARENGDWRPISLLKLAASALGKNPARWTSFNELARWLQELAERDLIVIWDENVHFTQEFVSRLQECSAGQLATAA